MARINLGSKPYIFPMPVLIIGTYDENGNPNAMTAAWGGTADTDEIFICLSQHKTTDNIKLKKCFTVSMGNAANMKQCDYVGIVSGNKVENKIEKAGWTVTKSEIIDAPIINELPLTLECELKQIIGTEQYIGKILNVSVDESILTDKDVDIKKLLPLIFDPSGSHGYYTIGERTGDAFKSGKELM